jgi:hypothetical protein
MTEDWSCGVRVASCGLLPSPFPSVFDYFAIYILCLTALRVAPFAITAASALQASRTHTQTHALADGGSFVSCSKPV